MPKSAALVSLACLTCLLGACASPPAGTAASGGADPAQAVVCSREAPTGSMFNVTKCRTAEQIEREREATRAAGEGIERARSGLRGPTGP